MLKNCGVTALMSNQQQTNITAADSAMERIGVELHEIDENVNLINDNRKRLKMQCTANIYNAFLILTYSGDFQITQEHLKPIRDYVPYTLCIISYIIALAQWIALMFLIRITMLAYPLAKWDGITWHKEDDRPRSTFFLWPFFLFAVIATLKASKQSELDIMILRDKWNISRIRCGECKWKNINVFLLKVVTEQYLAYFGGLAYLIILVICTQNQDEWNHYDSLVVILNLLVYQMILDVDQYVYGMFKGLIAEYMAQALDDERETEVDGLFDGYIFQKEGYSFIDSSRFLLWMISSLFVASGIQAIYSRRYAFFVGVFGILVLPGVLVWGWFLTKHKKKQ